MAVGEYLKVAAAQLRRAAQARKSEADEMRKEIDYKEHEKRSNLQDMQKEERDHQAQASVQEDPNAQAYHLQKVMRLKSQESETEKEYNRTKDNIAQQISMAENDVNDLLQRAGELERMSAQM
jgi:hypothetical protein